MANIKAQETDDLNATIMEVGGIETVNLSSSNPEHGQARMQENSRSGPAHDLEYALEDIPPWYTTILLGLQNFTTNFGSNISTAFILAPYLCISHDPIAIARITGTLFFVTGMVTVLQTTLGVRLPIIQGVTFSFMVPTFSILRTRGECPPAPTDNSTVEMSDAAEEEWLARIREIQGAIMVASCVQVVIGATGIVGILINFIGPITVTSVVTLIGLGVHKPAAEKSGKHWGIAVMTMVLIALLSQYMPEIGVPVLSCKSQKKCHMTRFKLFKLFPIILGVAVVWLFCVILTAIGVFPDDPNVYGYAARTDLNTMVMERAPWFSFPYPGQWGTPTVRLSSVLGMTAGVFASIVDSVGDYYACARMCGAPPPPQHAINRGVLIEGIGCILAGAWGSGNGTTSHSSNIGIIALTKVGSRVVVQAAGCILMFTGLLGKFSAFFATTPEPIVGGVLCIVVSMVTSVGLSNLQFVDLNSSRNLFIVGFSILMGLVVPYYLEQNPGILKTGFTEIDQIISVMLTTGMFVGGFLAILLDNTIPGTDEERGIHSWRQHITSDAGNEEEGAGPETDKNREGGEGQDIELDVMHVPDQLQADVNEKGSSMQTASPDSYDLPLVMRFVRRWAWCRYLPFSPTFRGCKFGWMKKICKKKESVD